MNLFSIDPGLAIWTWIVFAVLLVLLWKFAFPALIKSLKEREQTISEAVDDALHLKQQLADVEKEHKQMLNRTKTEADEILRKTRQEAEVLRKRLLDKAEKEAQDIIDQANIELEEDRKTAKKSLQLEIADFICDTSEKIIGKSFTTEKDRDWAKELPETL